MLSHLSFTLICDVSTARAPFPRWGNWGTEMFRNFPQLMWLVRKGRDWVQTQKSWLRSLIALKAKFKVTQLVLEAGLNPRAFSLYTGTHHTGVLGLPWICHTCFYFRVVALSVPSVWNAHYFLPVCVQMSLYQKDLYSLTDAKTCKDLPKIYLLMTTFF